MATEEGRGALIRSLKKNAVLNLALMRWAEKEGLTEEQSNELPLWISLDNLDETIHYLCGKPFKL